MLLTRPDNLSDTDRTLRDGLAAACPEMTALSNLVHTFAELLRPTPDNAERLDAWITAARAGDHPHLGELLGALHLHEAEVHEADAAAAVGQDHEDVRGLDVAVDDGCRLGM